MRDRFLMLGCADNEYPLKSIAFLYFSSWDSRCKLLNVGLRVLFLSCVASGERGALANQDRERADASPRELTRADASGCEQGLAESPRMRGVLAALQDGGPPPRYFGRS